MEMEISVREAANQAAFMLSAIRELRADGRELKKKRQETQSSQKGSILGPLLGPAIKADKGAAEKPPGFEVPDNLEFVGLELDLPVGFRRLRWAMLSSKSQFLIEGVLRTEAKYDKYVFFFCCKSRRVAHPANSRALEFQQSHGRSTMNLLDCRTCQMVLAKLTL